MEKPPDLPGDSLLDIARAKQHVLSFQNTTTWACSMLGLCSNVEITNCVITSEVNPSCLITLTHWKTILASEPEYDAIRSHCML